MTIGSVARGVTNRSGEPQILKPACMNIALIKRESVAKTPSKTATDLAEDLFVLSIIWVFVAERVDT